MGLNNKTILVTGSPGFIGANVVQKLLKETNSKIISLDNLNSYYDVRLKKYRLEQIKQTPTNGSHKFIKGDISNKSFVDRVFSKYRFDIVVNLAAQAGVRYSIENPDAYMESNVIGFYNILEACRKYKVKHLVYASSSSVYGNNPDIPFKEEACTDNPVSFYAATKKTNEIMAYSYSSLYGLPTTGLRLFSVYGPAGRPDMFYYSATEKAVKGEKIKLFNGGRMSRDFTYIDDVVDCIYKIIEHIPISNPPYKIYNIGNEKHTNISSFINILNNALKSEGIIKEDIKIELTDMQTGDVLTTCANNVKIERDFGYSPKTDIIKGLTEFCKWYSKK